MANATTDQYRSRDGDEWRQAVETLRVIIVSGVATGALAIGVGSRLAMMLLRLTSPEQVHGVVSDDGFVIGRVTLAGSYNLLVIGAGFGIIGAGAYRLVAPYLIGPLWFRRMTTGLASGAVVGAMLIHADGVDFTQLKPTWLAIAVFIALPTLFGVAIGPTVDAVTRRGSSTDHGRRRWVLPLVSLACFPPAIVIAAAVAGAVGVLTLAGTRRSVRYMRRSPIYTWTMRSLWLTTAVIGLFTLIGDTRSLLQVLAASGSAR